jgi:ATP-dependent RNA helicase DeaD
MFRDEDFEFGYTVSEPSSEVVQSSSASGGQPPIAAEQGTTVELFVNVGRGDGATAEDFLRVLQQAGIVTIDASQINLRRNHSFVRVPSEDQVRAEAALTGATIAGKTTRAERSRSSRS